MTGVLTDKRVRIVLYEGSGSRPLSDDQRFEAMVALLEDGHPVTRPAPGHQVAAQDGSDYLVLGQFDQLPAAAGQLAFHDISDLGADDVRSVVQRELPQVGAEAPGAWKPWFPVIDYDRCTNCMQCLSFCLFDVYGTDEEGKIQVQNESNCKTNCPACSRVCPEVAILFPKYKKGPINGDVVREEDIQRESMKVDISALLGGDIYSSLRGRSEAARKRFSTERDESKALLERKRCLKDLKESLDIPDEVLMTLPSVGEIEERTRRAKEKAERRRAASQSIKDEEAARPAPSVEEWDI